MNQIVRRSWKGNLSLTRLVQSMSFFSSIFQCFLVTVTWIGYSVVGFIVKVLGLSSSWWLLFLICCEPLWASLYWWVCCELIGFVSYAMLRTQKQERSWKTVYKRFKPPLHGKPMAIRAFTLCLRNVIVMQASTHWCKGCAAWIVRHINVWSIC